jgi:hypothetical protein
VRIFIKVRDSREKYSLSNWNWGEKGKSRRGKRKLKYKSKITKVK